MHAHAHTPAHTHSLSLFVCTSAVEIVYFVNAQHLLEDTAVLRRLSDRLEFLNAEMPAGTSVLVRGVAATAWRLDVDMQLQ